SLSLLYSFFFQAEDGIRDFHVTGVQTCALPIYARRSREPFCLLFQEILFSIPRSILTTEISRLRGIRLRAMVSVFRDTLCQSRRSEERRVGKECRSRWLQC